MSRESSAKQTIHIEFQDLFSLKKNNNNKQFRMFSAINFAGALGINNGRTLRATVVSQTKETEKKN